MLHALIFGEKKNLGMSFCSTREAIEIGGCARFKGTGFRVVVMNVSYSSLEASRAILPLELETVEWRMEHRLWSKTHLDFKHGLLIRTFVTLENNFISES